MDSSQLILLTGATGYIGGRLLKELEAQGSSRSLPGPAAGVPACARRERH